MRRILDQAVVVVVEVVVAVAIVEVVVAVAEDVVVYFYSCHIVEDIGPRLIPSRGSVTQGEGCKEIGRGSKMKIFSFFMTEGTKTVMRLC